MNAPSVLTEGFNRAGFIRPQRLHSQSQNIFRSIEVAANMQATTWTVKDTVGKSKFLPVSTFVAILSCVGRVNFDQLPTGTFSLVRKHGEEPRPGRICNAFSQTMVMNHAIDAQIFNANNSIVIDNLTRFLMRKVISLESNSLMNAGNDFAPLGNFGSAFSRPTQFSLGFSQSFLLFPEKARTLNRWSSIRKSGESMQAHIDAHGFIVSWKGLRFDFTTKSYIPFASRRTAKSGCLGLAAHFSMHDDLDMTDLGNYQASIFNSATGRDLRKGEGIIPSLSLKAGKAGFFTGLAAAKEGFESQVNPGCHI